MMSPDLSVLTGTCGVGLICYEFNRPGRVLPAAAGLLLLLFAVASWVERGARLPVVFFLAMALCLCLANAWRAVPGAALLAACVGLAVSLRFLALPGAVEQVHWPAAAVCGAGLGCVVVLLTRIARHARRAKALN